MKNRLINLRKLSEKVWDRKGKDEKVNVSEYADLRAGHNLPFPSKVPQHTGISGGD
jgi:hypothetical protein